MKQFNCLQSRWNNILPEENESMRQAGYVVITRPATRSGLRKGRGQMITGQSVKPSMLPENARILAEQIVKDY